MTRGGCCESWDENADDFLMTGAAVDFRVATHVF
jgi:hypothetical protein